MTTPFNIEVRQYYNVIKDGGRTRYYKDEHGGIHFIYMRLTQYNAYGEQVVRWKFKSWK